MRLTKKTNFGYENESCEITQCSDKLGQLEDAEEELEIDLITLSKAIEGIKNKSVYNIEEKREVFVNGIFYYENNLIITGYSFDNIFSIKEYGITWALTKEELE